MEEEWRDIKEDIKILKKFIHKPVRQEKFNKISNKEIQAVEHILNRLEQDERIIKEMAECFFRYKSHFTTLDEYNNENQIIDHFRKRVDNIE